MVRISALAWPRLSLSSNSGRAASPKISGKPSRARRLDRVDVRIDRDIGLVVLGQHLGDQPPDPAEADDHRARLLAGRRDVGLAGLAAILDPPRRVAAEPGQQRRQRQAHRGDDLPEGGGVGGDHAGRARPRPSTISVVSEGEAISRLASAATARALAAEPQQQRRSPPS